TGECENQFYCIDDSCCPSGGCQVGTCNLLTGECSSVQICNPPDCCNGPACCDDSNGCTTDICEDGSCEYERSCVDSTEPCCIDGDPCTSDDCVDNLCENNPIGQPCSALVGSGIGCPGKTTTIDVTICNESTSCPNEYSWQLAKLSGAVD